MLLLCFGCSSVANASGRWKRNKNHKHPDYLVKRRPAMARRKNTKKPKRRNFVAVAGFQTSGAGRHKDRKKEANKRACRGKVRE
jgi:hypothetical protein